MHTPVDHPLVGASSPDSVRPLAPNPRPVGLVIATIRVVACPVASVSFVDELDQTAVARIRREACALVTRHGPPVVVELRYVAGAEATAAVADLEDLTAYGIRLAVTPLPLRRDTATVPPAPRTPAPVPAPEAAAVPSGDGVVGPDPFGVDPDARARWLPIFRFFFERYWRIETSGIEHVPAVGSAVIASNHSGAVPADAFMLAVALEVRHSARRCLRVLYDRFVDQMPWVAPFYRQCGGVPASLRNAERILERGEILALFPEGLAGLEKTWRERYQMRPFKTGAARLAIRTGSPLIPVAIVGAEEAYPVVMQLYRAGGLVGVPWIPLTPTFPLCGVAGAVPLPTKWYMRFCPPIQPPAVAPGEEEDAVRELTARLRDAIDGALKDVLAARPGLFV
jgi:1-acyl-sn-glycerol-3-phosphate acyltransferase